MNKWFDRLFKRQNNANPDSTVLPEPDDSIQSESIEETPAGNGVKKTIIIDKKKPRLKKKKDEVQEGTEEVPEVPILEETPGEAGVKKTILINKRKPWSLKKKIIIPTVSVIVAALLCVGGFVLVKMLNPLGGFDSVVEVSHTQKPTATPYVSDGELITPTVDPMEELMKLADFDKLKDIVNIMLIGVDHDEMRDSSEWDGKTDFHSDVMIILSINTNTNQASLISLPRDTYAPIPDVTGVYRMNAALNCGGGWPENPGDDTDAPFRKVCEAASWSIGGIPVDYYYAVDFTAVKQLVDAIGGVDFNVDIDFDMKNGRVYHKGLQHMNGQAVLDYLRVRKDKNIIGDSDAEGDLERINRQKEMLKAIFEKLKDSVSLTSLYNILNSFQGNLYTNVAIGDTLGFAWYAYNNIDPATIKVYSMDGPRKTLFSPQKSNGKLMDALGLVFPTLSKRVSIIKEVYGVDITGTKIYSDYKKYSVDNTVILWARMQNAVTVDKTGDFLDQMKDILDADAELDPEPTPEPSTPPSTSPSTPPSTSPSPSPSPSATSPSPSPSATNDTTANAAVKNAGTVSNEYRKYGDDVRALYAQAVSEYEQLAGWGKPKDRSDADKLNDVMSQFKTDFQSLCDTLSIKISKFKSWNDFWAVVFNTRDHSEFNQDIVHNDIFVDMR